MGAFCCHGNQSFDPICIKTLCSLSPTPVMLHIKFDQDWPAGFRDIQVWKCGQRTDNGQRRTDDGPLVYYKLTLSAFGSGELKTLSSHSPTWMMQHIKFDQDWPTTLRDIFMFESKNIRWQGMDRWTLAILKAHFVSLRLSWAKMSFIACYILRFHYYGKQ